MTTEDTKDLATRLAYGSVDLNHSGEAEERAKLSSAS